jgi:hypothetical protein
LKENDDPLYKRLFLEASTTEPHVTPSISKTDASCDLSKRFGVNTIQSQNSNADGTTNNNKGLTRTICFVIHVHVDGLFDDILLS